LGVEKESTLMAAWFRSYIKLVLASLLILSICLAGTGAQKKKKRTRRTKKPVAAKPVITNPAIAPPNQNGDVKVISTADQNGNEADPASEQLQPKKPKNSGASSEPKEDMQQTITTLSNQVNKLNDKLSQMQEDDRYQLDMERLTRAEQRAEQIRSQLIDTQGKIADLEAKRDQVEWSLKPENIERVTQGMGTLHPEEARDSRKRQLESEKSRLEAQLKILDTSKTRLETSSANADAEVDNLRAKLNQRREQMDAAPSPSPSPSNDRPKKPDQP
jgi:chromosome segregation ATPase